MKVRYDKLWRRMKDNQMKKSEVMMNLCKVFHCDIGDLMEITEED